MSESIFSLVYIIPLALALQHTLLMVSVPFLTMHFFAIPIQQYQNSFFCFQHSETFFPIIVCKVGTKINLKTNFRLTITTSSQR